LLNFAELSWNERGGSAFRLNGAMSGSRHFWTKGRELKGLSERNERVQRYLQRAEELRAVAETMKNEQARSLILATADEYRVLAQAVSVLVDGRAESEP